MKFIFIRFPTVQMRYPIRLSHGVWSIYRADDTYCTLVLFIPQINPLQSLWIMPPDARLHGAGHSNAFLSGYPVTGRDWYHDVDMILEGVRKDADRGATGKYDDLLRYTKETLQSCRSRRRRTSQSGWPRDSVMLQSILRHHRAAAK